MKILASNSLFNQKDPFLKPVSPVIEVERVQRDILTNKWTGAKMVLVAAASLTVLAASYCAWQYFGKASLPNLGDPSEQSLSLDVCPLSSNLTDIFVEAVFPNLHVPSFEPPITPLQSFTSPFVQDLPLFQEDFPIGENITEYDIASEVTNMANAFDALQEVTGSLIEDFVDLSTNASQVVNATTAFDPSTTVSSVSEPLLSDIALTTLDRAWAASKMVGAYTFLVSQWFAEAGVLRIALAAGTLVYARSHPKSLLNGGTAFPF